MNKKESSGFTTRLGHSGSMIGGLAGYIIRPLGNVFLGIIGLGIIGTLIAHEAEYQWINHKLSREGSQDIEQSTAKDIQQFRAEPTRVLVTGATGNQGGAVVDYLLASNTEFDVRGLTRNASSEAAQALEDRGVTMVEGDLNEPETLRPTSRTSRPSSR